MSGRERELALAGVEALADFIQECGLPTRLGELTAWMNSVQLLTSGTLKEIADSCNLIQTGQAQLNHTEIFEILKSCV